MTPQDLSVTLRDLLSIVPGASPSYDVGYGSYSTNGKVFAFVSKNGIVTKLPADRIDKLITSGKAVRLIMGKRECKEWAVLQRDTPAAYKRILPILLEAKSFVEAAAITKPAAKKLNAKSPRKSAIKKS